MNTTEETIFEERLLELKRTTTKRNNGPLFHYSALCVSGDREGHIGIALSKSSENSKAIARSKEKARKNIKKIAITKDFSIPYEIYLKNGAAKMFLKPAPLGSGIIAGGKIREILELAGIKNISVKILGTNNNIMNAYTLMDGLLKLRSTSK